MVGFLALILFVVFGAYGLIKGEIPLVGKRKVTGIAARILGIVLILVGLAIVAVPR